MTSRMDRRLEAAKELERRLLTQSRFEDAQIISSLRQSAISARTTCQTLHRDNMVLRRKLGLPAFADTEGEG